MHPRARWFLIGFAVNLALAGLFALAHGPDWFLHLGHNYAPTLELAQEKLGPNVDVPHEDGHDGRFFWVQARDPLLLHGRATGAALDRPAYRAQRVAYPLLAAPARAFGEGALLWALIAVNVLAAAAGTMWAALLCLELGIPERAALAFALCPAVTVSVLGDLGDVLSLAALVGCLLYVARRRWTPAIGLAVVSVLARESSLLAIAAAAAAVPGVAGRDRVRLVAFPAAAGVGWAVYERWRLAWPSSQIREFSAPFKGYVDAFRQGWSQNGNWADAIAAVAVLVVAAVVVLRWWRNRSWLLAAALPTAVMIPLMSIHVLDILLNSLRAAGPALLLLWIDLYRPKTLDPVPGTVDLDPQLVH